MTILRFRGPMFHSVVRGTYWRSGSSPRLPWLQPQRPHLPSKKHNGNVAAPTRFRQGGPIPREDMCTWLYLHFFYFQFFLLLSILSFFFFFQFFLFFFFFQLFLFHLFLLCFTSFILLVPTFAFSFFHTNFSS